MSRAPFRIMALDGTHDCAQFDCGRLALDRYLREQVTQDIRRRVRACFVALTDDRQIAGYYKLATASVPLVDLPDQVRRKLPRYTAIPAIRMRRQAVATPFKGMGFGSALLTNALNRAASSEISAAMFMVDAKDKKNGNASCVPADSDVMHCSRC